jgi:predicted nuclease of predicted toxin-antitoxin system
VPPRFLIDENLSPQLARHLRLAHGYDAVHVNEIGLQGAPDHDVLARALAERRIVITSNGDDFRRLGRQAPNHPGLAIILEATGRQQQIRFGVSIAEAIEARIVAAGVAEGCLFEIDRTGTIRQYRMP